MSQKHERARHEALAREIAAWTSWVVGDWFTDKHLAMMLDGQDHGRAMRLDFECSCPTDDDQRDHRTDLTRPCVFVDGYEADPDALRWLTRALELGMQAKGNAYVTIDHTPFEHPNAPGMLCYRAAIGDTDDERAWVALQKRYVDAVETYARPDRWAYFQLSAPGEPVKAPVVWALRGERNRGVGLIMPATCTGSAIEAQGATPGYRGDDVLPAPAAADGGGGEG